MQPPPLRHQKELPSKQVRLDRGRGSRDELELPKRHDAEKGSAPDMALRDSKRLWLIELKTEAGSHRAD